MGAGPEALRGGSWNNNQRNTRVSYRNNNHPDNFNNNIGFRVVVAHDFQHRGLHGRGPCRQSCGVTAPRRTRKTARSGPGRVPGALPLCTGHIQNRPRPLW